MIDNYYLNYDLNNDGVYKDADAIGIEDLNMYNIWIMLEQTYPECVKKLMEQLIKILYLIFFGFMMIDMYLILAYFIHLFWIFTIN